MGEEGAVGVRQGRGQQVTECSPFSSPPPPAPNPCEANGGRGPCSHLCLINYNRTVSCACPHLMKLHKDNTTCYGRRPLSQEPVVN